MNRLAALLLVFLLLPAVAPAKEKKPYVLYAEMKIGFYVDLGDGTKWAVERGDTFPVVMFKEQRAKVILQLAGTQFWINTEWVTTVEEKELTPAHLATYRKHVEKYNAQQTGPELPKGGAAQ